MTACITRDHPRVGGEKRFRGGSLQSQEGSPPHRRGKGFFVHLVHSFVGITPAWAGKSPDPPTPPTSGGDHPRMGGEKSKTRCIPCARRGSPPHGRGKGMTSWGGVLKDRITPAWAGKSPPGVGLSVLFGDHPRMGGEKQRMPAKTDKRMGSPPHGRGKVNFPPPASNGTGITPAWAGKS